jgi:two-component system, cell cycle sensor histidine kinase and response regulator CckA
VKIPMLDMNAPTSSTSEATRSRVVSPESLELANRRPAGRQPVVLLAEDNALVREAIRMLIEMQGCTVIEAKDGSQALAFGTAYAGPIDLFVSDAMMPGLNGPEVFKMLRHQRSDLPALFVSGYAQERVFPNGSLPSGAAFLHKPFSPGEFAKAFEHLVLQTALQGPRRVA